ncbi:hypothetical protein J5N97_012528 [Dioscorea zingiberensis]|uniref:Uncharacterized protein n=1 Tax=Dioscorea zingiberensis TaxID=325984 RepID=A0A9D5CPX3_9LILI|nr:hypothetical protein J5N97_012528 [Dioscorea zingiberensis]
MGSSSPLGIPAVPPSLALSNASINPSFLWTSGAGASSNHKRWNGNLRTRPTRQKWHKKIWRSGVGDGAFVFGSDEEVGVEVPTQAQSVVEGSGTVLVSEYKPIPDLDYLQELLAIQQQGPRAIGFFGTRNMGFMHQQLIEILSYAMIITKNHIYTSGASGTNAAVIRGALRAEKPELLTVILPQSLKMQPPESQELLSKVKNVIEKPQNDHLPLIEASRLCNMDILSHVQQVICFAFHDSKLLMETCQEARNLRKIVTLFYLD